MLFKLIFIKLILKSLFSVFIIGSLLYFSLVLVLFLFFLLFFAFLLLSNPCVDRVSIFLELFFFSFLFFDLPNKITLLIYIGFANLFFLASFLLIF